MFDADLSEQHASKYGGHVVLKSKDTYHYGKQAASCLSNIEKCVFFQLKVFCDKGAERKFRQEERRASRKVRFLNLTIKYMFTYPFMSL